MIFNKELKIKLKWVAIIIIGLIGLRLIFTSTLDNSSFYNSSEFKSYLDSIPKTPIEIAFDDDIKIGWSKTSITPTKPVRLAGYTRRHFYSEIKDSVFCRVLSLEGKKTKYAIVALDLIIIHPNLRIAIEKEVGNLVDGIYFSATHTHSSYGKWGKGVISNVIFGSYDEALVHFISSQVKKAIQESISTSMKGSIAYTAVKCPDLVANRVSDFAKVDPYLRLVSFKKENGEKALISTFSAHPTLCGISDYLSAEYPGVYSKLIEKDGYSLSLFMPSGVASTKARTHHHGYPRKAYENIDDYGNQLYDHTKGQLDSLNYSEIKSFSFHQLNIPMPKPQLRISNKTILSPSLFKSLLGNQKAYIRSLGINEYLFMGYPADFSGEVGLEITEEIQTKTKPLFTSFNGAYIGYLTHPVHYENSDSECQTMNWYGPRNTPYFKMLSMEYIKHIDKLQNDL